jgi:hypothetical protein
MSRSAHLLSCRVLYALTFPNQEVQIAMRQRCSGLLLYHRQETAPASGIFGSPCSSHALALLFLWRARLCKISETSLSTESENQEDLSAMRETPSSSAGDVLRASAGSQSDKMEVCRMGTHVTRRSVRLMGTGSRPILVFVLLIHSLLAYLYLIISHFK